MKGTWCALRRGTILCAALSSPALGNAYDNRWVGSVGDWSNAGNWSSPFGAPSHDSAYIDNNGIVRVTSTTLYNDYVILGSSNTELGNDGSGKPGIGTVLLSTSGSLLAGALQVGDAGTGTFTQTGGLAIIDRFGLSIGNTAGAVGTYTISQDPLTPVPVTQLYVHALRVGGGGQGTFNQVGGKVVVETFSNGFGGSILGVGGGDLTGKGTYNLNDGELQAETEKIYNSGSFVQMGGLNETRGVSVDAGGSFTLSGGVLNAFRSHAGDIGTIPGDFVMGSFVQSGGYHLADSLYVYTGTYNLTAGDLQSNGAAVYGDPSQPGRIRQSGGAVSMFQIPGDGIGSGPITLQIDSNGIYEMTEAPGTQSTFLQADILEISDTSPVGPGGVFNQLGGTATFGSMVIGGRLNTGYFLKDGVLSGGDATLGTYQPGVFQQSGGVSTFNSIFVKDGSQIAFSGGRLSAGAVGLSGGQLSLDGGSIDIGSLSADSGAIITQTAGSHVTRSLALGTHDGLGIFELSGGTLSAGTIYIGGLGTGIMNVTAGVLTTGSAIVGSGNPGTGKVTLSGINSGWVVQHDSYIAARGAGVNGAITVADGAQLRIEGQLFSQAVTNSNGSIVLKSDSASNVTASLITNQLTLAGGKFSGNGKIAGIDNGNTQVQNYGEFAPQGSYFNVVPGLNAQIVIQGNYTQGAGGKTSLIVNDDNRYGAGGGIIQNVPLVVTGTAAFHGALDVDSHFASTSANSLAAGDRFHLVRFGDVTSRFDSFNGANIPNRDDLFFGLNYRDDGSGQKGLDLVALSTPRLAKDNSSLTAANASGSGLVLVTHGWNSSVQGQWAQTMAQTIQARKTNNWDVVTVDWQKLADQAATDGGLNITADNAIDIGQSLYFWMHENGLDARYAQGVHLMGHSAGSWLVDGLADKLRAGNSTLPVYLTLFDAYTPMTEQGLSTIPELGSTPVIGDHATFAEHIVDKHLGSYPLLKSTNASLPGFFNLDISPLAPDTLNPVTLHGWPYAWYQNSIDFPKNLQGAKYGFPGAIEAGANPLGSFASLVGHTLIVHADGTIDEWNSVKQHAAAIVPTAQTSITSTTGKITFGAAGITLATGSPAILTTAVQLAQEENLFSFGYQFLSAADGLLSVYVDNTLLASIDSLDMGGDRTPQFSGDLWLAQTLEPGLHTLIFRLDPDGSDQAIAQILDMQFSFAQLEPIPEPATVGLVAFATVLLCHRRGGCDSRRLTICTSIRESISPVVLGGRHEG